MVSFDVSKKWVILVPSSPAARKGAEDISRCIGSLGGQNGEGAELADASGPAPPETSALIVLNYETEKAERNGFSWRAGSRRIEIYGESERGLCNGIYDFLSSLGISWPDPERELFPALRRDKIYPLQSAGAYAPSKNPEHSGRSSTSGKKATEAFENSRKRLFVSDKNPFLRSPKKRETLIIWAARNRYDVLTLSLRCWASLGKAKAMADLREQAEEFAISIEAGGELSMLLPRWLFVFHRDLFRMEGGKRRMHVHFCPTNPETIEILKKTGRKFFRAAQGVKVFHLWPEKGEEKTWCSCPSCRAFSPPEQNRIAVNAAADALAEINRESGSTGASISILETADASFSPGLFENPGNGENIPLRPNVFRITSPGY